MASPLEWTKLKEKDGISTFKKDLPNGALISFKGIGTVKASLKKVFNIIMDTQRAPEWVADMEKSQVLDWVKKPHTYIEYNHIKMPLIIKDRDFISKVNMIKESDKTILINYSTTDHKVNSKNIRGEINGSYFRLTALGENETLIEGVVICDPKGLIPKWIVNLFQKNWPYDTISGIRKQALKKDLIEDPRYDDYFFN